MNFTIKDGVREFRVGMTKSSDEVGSKYLIYTNIWYITTVITSTDF